MEGQRTDYTLDEMCVVLAVSKSGYVDVGAPLPSRESND